MTTANTSFNLKSIMNRAWMLIRKYGLSMSEALKKAWAVAKTIKKMLTGVAHFYFTKADGTIREAFGRLVNVPATAGVRTTPSHLVTYYDCEKEAWRSFKAINFIRVA